MKTEVLCSAESPCAHGRRAKIPPSGGKKEVKKTNENSSGKTSSGHPTDQYGNKLGPSGEPQINTVKHSTQKSAKDAARNAGKGAPVKHTTPKKEVTIIIRLMEMEKKYLIALIMNIDNNVWIGLAHVSDNKNHALLNGAEEAYVNVLALAINKREFINKVKSSLLEIGFDFINIEDVELYTQRIKNFEVDEIIKNLEKRVRETKATQFSSFHTFNEGS